MQKKNKDTIVVGLGNEILTDDGIGPALCKEMEKLFPLPNIKYITATTGGLEILEMIRDYKTVMIIDAIRTKNGIPGTVYYLTPSDFKETLNISNIHDISFLTALKLGEKLGINMPETIHIIAVEIIEDLVFSESFSPEIQRCYDSIVQTTKTFFENILKSDFRSK